MSPALLRAGLILLTFGGFALRVYGLHRQSFWLDEVDALSFAAAPVAAQLRKLTAIGENGPFYFILLKGWLALAGTSEFGARFLSAITSTLAIPLAGVLAQRLFRHPPTTLIAAALAAGAPYYVWYAQDAKMYPLFAALALGAQYCFLRAWSRAPASSPAGRPPRSAVWWWAGYVLCSSCALYVHLFAALQIAANTAAGLWLWPGRRSGWRGFGAATLLLVLPYLPLAVWQAPVLLRGADVGYRPAGPGTILVTLLEGFTWHLNPEPSRRWLLPLGALLIWGLWRARARSGTAAAVLSIWLVVPLTLTLLLQGTVPVFRDRYLIPLVMPLLLLMARAIAPPWALDNPLGLAGTLFVVAGFGYGQLHRPPNPDFRAAAALVLSTAAPDEPVGFLAGYAERPFDFYFYKDSSGAGGAGKYERIALPYTNYPGLTEGDGLHAVAISLRGGRWLWVVRFEDWLWDERDLTGQYLAGRGARAVLRRDFDGVSVTRYELPT